MLYLLRLGGYFDPAYVKPSTLNRAVSLLVTNGIEVSVEDRQQSTPRRQQDRRCGVERRGRQRPIILDTRCPHARRQQSRRRQRDIATLEDSRVGIDVFA